MTSIRLGERQSAEPNTCGSCDYYRGSSGDSRGNCGFKMPPWIRLLHAHASETTIARDGSTGGRPAMTETFENSGDPTMVYDTQTCSFWAPSGLTYVQDRTWTVGK